ncbi:hypothetical protein Tco_0089741 [Tanacetum coccineum]
MSSTHRSILNDEYLSERNLLLRLQLDSIFRIHDTMIQNMGYVKKQLRRALHKLEYDSRVNERLMQTTEEKVDSSKALDASLVIIESNETESQEQDTSSRNDAHADDADIRPIYNEEPMAKVQTTAKINVFAIGQQHTEQPELNNEGLHVQSYRGRTQSLIAKKKDISENRASKNFDLMITKRRLIAAVQASVINVQMVSAKNNTSGPVPQCSKDV